jgi:signal transduction histidine kinase
MFLDLIRGVLSVANVFIAIFIVIYAMLFLKQTRSHRERRPWDYLVVASTIYLVYTLFTMLLANYGSQIIFNLSLEELSIFFQFIYSGLILLAFISQTDLIFKNEIIIITRKLEPVERTKLEATIEKDILRREEKVIKKETEEIKEKEEEIKEETDEIKKEEDEIKREEQEIKKEEIEIKEEAKDIKKRLKPKKRKKK